MSPSYRAAFVAPLIAVLSCLACAALSVSCAKEKEGVASTSRVVVVTPSESAAPGEYRGAEAFARDYADPKSGAVISHIVFPDVSKGGAEDAVAAFVAQAASDPLVGAIVVDPAPRGTASGLRRAKSARTEGGKPGLVCIAGSPSDDALAIESAADLVVSPDRVYRAYIVAWAAKKMGASSLAAFYVRSSDPEAARERAIMSAAAADLGLAYSAMSAGAGVDAAAFAREGADARLKSSGPATAFYSPDFALAPSLIASAVAGKGLLVDAAGELTRAFYARALGLDLSAAEGDAKKEQKLLETAVASAGMKGRLCLWEAGYDEASVRGMGEYAVRLAKGGARKGELKDFLACLDARSKEDGVQGAAWLGSYDVDPSTGVKSANRVLLRQDYYAIGSGWLQSALQTVPSKYLLLKSGDD
jgi:hypothetical protein